MNERHPISLKALHDKTFAAEQPHADLAIESDTNTHTFGRAQERVLLANELAAVLTEINWNDLARKWRPKRDLLLSDAAILEHCHEKRLTGEQPLASAHQRTENPFVLPRAVTEDRLHLDPVLHV